MKKYVVLLLLCLSGTVMFAEGLHYEVNTDGCDTNSYTTVTGVLMIDNEEVFNGNLEIGVFDQDGICRGAGKPDWKQSTYHLIYTLRLRGKDEFYYPTFKIYDHESETELEDLVLDIEKTIIWSPNESYGSSSGPYSINFKTSYTKEITGYGYGNDHWYLIASPVEVDPEDVHFMITDDPDSYDLYRFNQSAELEWENWKAEGDHNQFPLELGRGYLYANSEDVTLTFNGTPYDGDGIIELTKSDGAHFAGWNLIGNPFSGTAYIDREFYVMNEQGSEIVPAERDYIESMEGVFVVAEEDGETVTFSTEAPSARSASLALNLSRGSVAPSSTRGTIDRVIVRFGEGRMLPKFQLNPSHTKVYIPMDGKDYAVVRSEGRGEMPVNFKADANGSYTLSVSTEEVSLNYLHLIDSKTGNDIDLLKTPDYTFEASTTDDASRFKMVFAQEGNTKTNTLADVMRNSSEGIDTPCLPRHGEEENQPAWVTPTYEITATANPTEGGNVTGAGFYTHGMTCTLTATPNEGYHFVNWTKNDVAVSTNDTYSFTTTEDGCYVANFSSNTYTLNDDANNSTTISSNSGKMGNVTLQGRTLYKDGEWNTLCLPFDVDLTDEDSPLYGAIAKTLTDATMTGTHVTLTFSETPVTTLSAGVPYIIKWNKASDYEDDDDHNIVEPVFTDVTILNKTEAQRTIEKAGGHVKFIGYYDAFDIDADDDDIYYMTAGSTLKHTGKARTLLACRAYFQFSEAAAARQFVLNFGDDTQGIDDAVANSSLFSLHSSLNEGWYTLDGRKLDGKPTKKGLYIQNGRVAVIK